MLVNNQNDVTIFAAALINFFLFIPVLLQAASLLAAFAHPGHIVIYAAENPSVAAAMQLELFRVNYLSPV